MESIEFEYIKLFSNCLLTNGRSRSVICDLQRSRIHLIPNSLYELFDSFGLIEVAKLRCSLDVEDGKVFEEYVKMLIDNELAFFCNKEDIECFPNMSLEWDFPSDISNCIIDSKVDDTFLNKQLIDDLESIFCNYLQLRHYKELSLCNIKNILYLVANSQIKSIDLILKWVDDVDYVDQIKELVKQNRKVSCLTFHSALTNCILDDGIQGNGIVVCVATVLDSHMNCGIIGPEYFVSNIQHFTESQQYNTCLNRKVCIDVDGYIKNCPSMNKSYGHISDTMLKDVVSLDDFKSVWRVDKSQINVCMGCEFRHVCTDCRAYIEDPQNIYSKPLKCGYDPDTCRWENWSTNPLKLVTLNKYYKNV